MNKNYLFVICVSAVAFAGKAQSDSTYKRMHWVAEKFKISVGFFLPINNTNISVGNNQNNIGTNIDFENDLGFKRNTATFLGDIQWRTSSRSRFELSYYSLKRSANYTLQKSIEFGNHTYAVNAKVQAFFNTDIYRFSYGYALISKPKWEAGILIGAHIVSGTIGIGLASNNVSTTLKDNFGFTAPLPDLGIWNSYALNKRLFLNGELDYLAITIGNIKGSILSYSVSVNYSLLKNIQLAGGYTLLNFKVDATSNKLYGHLKWGYNGPSLSAAYLFGHKIKRTLNR